MIGSIRRAATAAAVAATMAAAVAALAPGAASATTSGIKWYHSPNFAAQAQCVQEKNRYVVDYGLTVMPLDSFCFGSAGAYYFEYMQEF